MSANLKWEPAKREAGDLPDGLKFALRDKRGMFQSGDGRERFDESDLNYLRGLMDAGIEGAQELIELIEKHEAVELWLGY